MIALVGNTPSALPWRALGGGLRLGCGPRVTQAVQCWWNRMTVCFYLRGAAGDYTGRGGALVRSLRRRAQSLRRKLTSA
ncbi:MAG: hypothetical protein ACLRRT_01365 [Ruthenibacterium lactatiformans]